MFSKFGMFILFMALTAGSALAWKLTKSDWWGGIFGNMAVGLVTLLCVDLLLEKALDNQRKPAVAVSVDAAMRVYGESQRFVFDLYGATVLSGNITEAEHLRLQATKEARGMAPYLAKTPLRQVTFNEPERPAIVYMYQDALEIQQSVNLALATHSEYLDPGIVSALYKLGQTKLVTFTISSVQIGAVPEKFDEPMFTEFFDRVDDLRKAMEKADPKLKGTMQTGNAYLMFSQPGMFDGPKR